jgi:nitrogen fixation/metabolism regulation signal transduction histidine kinase
MHGILAYGSEDYGGMCLFLCIEVVILFLALFAVYYATQEERRRAVTFIAPAVIWEIYLTLYFGYFVVKEFLSGNLFGEKGVISSLASGFMGGFMMYMMLPLIMILIVGLIIWFKSRQ